MEQTGETIELVSGMYPINQPNMGYYVVNGLKCNWCSVQTPDHRLFLVWTFDWDELDSPHRCIGITGKISCVLEQKNTPFPPRFTTDAKVELRDENKVFQKEVDPSFFEYFNAFFEFSLTPILLNTKIYEDMFKSSEKNDAILEVEGRMLHVNKQFLSYHSDYFHTLFSNRFMDVSMDVIPIKNITFAEIGLLFSTIYPAIIFPSDKSIPKLIELADRFLMPSVTRQIKSRIISSTSPNLTMRRSFGWLINIKWNCCWKR